MVGKLAPHNSCLAAQGERDAAATPATILVSGWALEKFRPYVRETRGD